MSEEDVRRIIREELWFLTQGNDKLVFSFPIQIKDGRNVQLGKTTGTIFGTETTQKIGFFNTNPVSQQADVGALSETGAASDASARANINGIRTALRNLGFMA